MRLPRSQVRFAELVEFFQNKLNPPLFPGPSVGVCRGGLLHAAGADGAEPFRSAAVGS
jgi:hypothetical protein